MTVPRHRNLGHKAQTPPEFQGFRSKRMKGFEPSTFAMATREIHPETRKLARFAALNMA